MEIAINIRKVTHVPTQMWKRWNPNSLLSRRFSALGRFKSLIGGMVLVLGACLMTLFLIPLVFQSIRTIMEATIEKIQPLI
jgi:hypothetical protein